MDNLRLIAPSRLAYIHPGATSPSATAATVHAADFGILDDEDDGDWDEGDGGSDELGVSEVNGGEFFVARLATSDGSVVYLGKYPRRHMALAAYEAAKYLLGQQQGTVTAPPDATLLTTVRRRCARSSHADTHICPAPCHPSHDWLCINVDVGARACVYACMYFIVFACDICSATLRVRAAGAGQLVD